MKRTVQEAVFQAFEKTRHYKQAYIDACKELDNTPRHMLDEGNPNHPMYDQIFGYDREEFMARQYK